MMHLEIKLNPPISRTSRETEIGSSNRGKITTKCFRRETKMSSRNRYFRETEGLRNRDSTARAARRALEFPASFKTNYHF